MFHWSGMDFLGDCARGCLDAARFVLGIRFVDPCASDRARADKVYYLGGGAEWNFSGSKWQCGLAGYRLAGR